MIAYFARHPTAANLLMVIFLVLGVASFPQLRRETFPDITPWEVEVRVLYPGATAEEVEEAICQRVEDAVDGVKFVKEVRSDAREGLGTITVEMEEGGDFINFKDEISTEVEAIDSFPGDAEDPVIRQLGTTDNVIALLVSGPMTPTDLKSWCEDLKNRLQQLPEVSLVDIAGFSDRQLRIELSSEALTRYGLTASDVAEVVARQSVSTPAGGIETRETDILLRFVEQRRSPRELEALVIKGGAGGAEVQLGNLGRVVDLFEYEENQVRLGNRRAGLLQISKTKNQDIIRVADAVKEFVQRERERHPQIELIVTQDGSTLVADRLQMLIKNGLQGMLLVFLTLWLFFNVRLSFWVAMSLPVSFFGAFYFMPMFGLTVNMLTMVGMLLALGLLMDDGIVIAENIATHRATGKSAMKSAIDGVNEVRAGVFSSFLTTVCVLGPLTMISGDIGKVLKVVPMILILVMSVSLVEAFAILPAHLGHSLHGTDPERPGRFRHFFDSIIAWTRDVLFGRTVDLLLRVRYLWLGTVVAVFLVAIGMLAGGVVKFQAFPDLDGDVLSARMLLPAGTPLKRTEELIDRVTLALERVNATYTPNQPDGQALVQNVTIEFNKNRDAFETGPHVATVNVDLLNAEIRDGRIDDMIADWNWEICNWEAQQHQQLTGEAWPEERWNRAVGNLPEVISLTITEPMFGPAGRPIEVRLQGHDLERLKLASTELTDWFSRFKGVRNLADDLRPGKPEIRLRLKEGSLGLGFDAANLANQLRTAYSGFIADEIQVGPESYEIDVRLNPSEQDSLADLEYFQFKLPNGKFVPIHAVTTAESRRGWSRIAHVNGRRTVSVRGDLDSRVVKATTLISRLRKDLLPEWKEKYPEIEVTFEGEVSEGSQTRGSMMKAMLLGMVGVFILLSFQFRSYIEPLIVMVAIPLALIGVIFGHWLIDVDVSMPSMLGFVSLSGVVVNDSILLVLFLKMQLERGASIHVAAAQASRKRFRAIMLTSLTTIAGLLPLLFERSLQAQVLIPLAVSIAFGMMASTVLVLLVIPCLYTVLADFGLIRSEQVPMVETVESELSNR